MSDDIMSIALEHEKKIDEYARICRVAAQYPVLLASVKSFLKENEIEVSPDCYFSKVLEYAEELAYGEKRKINIVSVGE